VTRRYRYETTIPFGCEGGSPVITLDVRVTHTVAWGSPESGRWGPPEDYDPGSPDIVEDVRVETIAGKPRPWSVLPTLSDDALAEMIIRHLEAQHDDMLHEAAEREQGEKEDAEESRWEERREELRKQ
jgi:hypothetical protein